MTSALEIGGGFLFMATLLMAVMFLAAFQLGRLVTRDDEQHDVEVVRARGKHCERAEMESPVTTARYPARDRAALVATL